MTKEDKRRYLILKDPNIYKGLIILALPIMINNFIKTIHDLVDMFFVSNIPDHGTDAVSSISITFPFVFMFISLGMGLAVAGTALISQLIGGNQMDEAKKYATNLFFIAIVTGIILNILQYFGAPTVMKLMGAEGFMLENSIKYLKVRSFELTFIFIFYAFVTIRQSDGDTLTPVIYGVITIILNIVLSPIFITVLGFGVAGAAYATLIANAIVVPFILYQLFFGKDTLKLSLKHFTLHKATMKHIMKLALPASSGQAITAVGFIIMNSIIISYGVQTVAAFSIGNRISSMILHPVMAIGAVVAAYIGQNIGNANPERAREAVYKAMILGVGVMTMLSLIVLFVREPLAGIFLDEDPQALTLAVTYLFYLLIGLPLMAIFQTFIGAFNGNGKTIYSFIVQITRLWLLRIPLIYIFRNFTDLGNSGIWTAMLLSNFVIVFVGFAFYKSLKFQPRMELDL